MSIPPENVGDKPCTETSEASVSGQQWLLQIKKSVNVHVLVAGETFHTHDTFMKKLKLKLKLKLTPKLRPKLRPKLKLIKVDTQESCNIILLFCPVVSRIGTDMEAAMARVTEGKPVILVFMHHCHDASHLTNITVQPSRSNIVQVVHCAFHETKGLLECEKNKQAVKEMRSALLRYVDSHDEVPHIQSEQQMAAQGDNTAKITNDKETPGMGTDPAREKKQSSSKQIQSAKGHSAESVEVHVLVAGETFSVHETFIQKLKRIKPCSAESCNVILLFCPVVSRIGTDMEAAMSRVTEDKPVILVFMHHCHSPSHVTNITVQPSGNNIVKTVHCAFLETEGLLQCKENDQAVEEVRLKLKEYKNKRMKNREISQESKHD